MLIDHVLVFVKIYWIMEKHKQLMERHKESMEKHTESTERRKQLMEKRKELMEIIAVSLESTKQEIYIYFLRSLSNQ